MNCIVTSIEHEDQDYVTVHVDVLDNASYTVSNHELSFDIQVFIDRTPAEKVDIIKRALRNKLVSELNMSELVGEQFTLDNLYRKAFA